MKIPSFLWSQIKNGIKTAFDMHVTVIERIQNVKTNLMTRRVKIIFEKSCTLPSQDVLSRTDQIVVK